MPSRGFDLRKQSMKRSVIKTPFHNGDNGRDSNGRFANGNPGGPGRPQNYSTEMQAVLNNCFDAHDIRSFADRIRKLALEGSPSIALKAVSLLWDRILG
jgi:hypothetical protein